MLNVKSYLCNIPLNGLTRRVSDFGWAAACLTYCSRVCVCVWAWAWASLGAPLMTHIVTGECWVWRQGGGGLRKELKQWTC